MHLFKKHFHNKSNDNNNNKIQTFHPIQKISINSLYPPLRITPTFHIFKQKILTTKPSTNTSIIFKHKNLSFPTNKPSLTTKSSLHALQYLHDHIH